MLQKSIRATLQRQSMRVNIHIHHMDPPLYFFCLIALVIARLCMHTLLQLCLLAHCTCLQYVLCTVVSAVGLCKDLHMHLALCLSLIEIVLAPVHFQFGLVFG